MIGSPKWSLIFLETVSGHAEAGKPALPYRDVSPDHSFSLAPSDVHVWQADLDAPEMVRHRLGRLLVPEEQARAARFYFERDRQRYLAGRGLLRLLLGRYLGRPPEGLELTYNRYGRPSLAGSDNLPPLHFNLSHSGPIALFAFTLDRPLGVDVERIRSDLDHEKIAERFFSLRERQVLHNLSAMDMALGFFNAWTRKEAYIKALGMGLSLPLDSFDVTLAPGRPARLLEARQQPGEADHWTLYDLAPRPGYCGALAVRDRGLTLHHWSCDFTRLIP